MTAETLGEGFVLQAAIKGLVARPETQDGDVIDDVLVKNEYRLPRKFNHDDVIVDIGANIGAFTVGCHALGSRAVIAFEPDFDNFVILSRNTEGLEGVGINQSAVWRSDRPELMTFSGYINGHTACGTILKGYTTQNHNARIPVNTIQFDRAIEIITQRTGRTIRLLKLDAEGAEYPILFTSKKLHLIQEIVGEFHHVGDLRKTGNGVEGFHRYDSESGKEFMERHGFAVELVTQTDHLTAHPNVTFFAKRSKA